MLGALSRTLCQYSIVRANHRSASSLAKSPSAPNGFRNTPCALAPGGNFHVNSWLEMLALASTCFSPLFVAFTTTQRRYFSPSTGQAKFFFQSLAVGSGATQIRDS